MSDACPVTACQRALGVTKRGDPCSIVLDLASQPSLACPLNQRLALVAA
jgi:hypothetical protein